MNAAGVQTVSEAKRMTLCFAKIVFKGVCTAGEKKNLARGGVPSKRKCTVRGLRKPEEAGIQQPHTDITG